MSASINRRIAVGAGWMVSLRWVDRLIAFISIAVLARLLVPADFGLLGYAMVILGTLEQLSAFNFQTVLIRDQDAPKDRYDTAWTLQVIKGVAVSAVLLVSAGAVAKFFDEPTVEAILYWIAVIPILRGTVNIGIVDFHKNLELHKVFILDVVARLLGTIATLALAFYLRSFWALVYGQIAVAALRLGLSYGMSDFRPRFCLSEVSRVFGFSKWVLVHNICASINLQIPATVVGRFTGTQALGIFNIGKQVAYLITDQFAQPIRHALFPGLAKIRDDNVQMERTILSTLSLVVLVGLPAAAGVGVTAPVLIPAFLGENWAEAIPVVGIMAIAASIGVFHPNSSAIFYALDRPQITAYITVLRMLFLVPVIFLTVPEFGVIGAAWALVASSAFGFVLDYSALFRFTNIKGSGVFAGVWRSVLATIVMAICVTYVVESPLATAYQVSMILHLAMSVALGVASYVVTIAVLWSLSNFPNGPEAYILRMVKSLYKQRPVARSNT